MLHAKPQRYRDFTQDPEARAGGSHRPEKETITLKALTGTVAVTAQY
jgi:hypothetical protein